LFIKSISRPTHPTLVDLWNQISNRFIHAHGRHATYVNLRLGTHDVDDLLIDQWDLLGQVHTPVLA